MNRKLFLLPALSLLVWVPASFGADFWDITGNINTTDASFLGTRTGFNFDVVFKTDGFERMRVLKRKGGAGGNHSDVDGLVQITTNLRLFDPANQTLYSGDLIMPLGRWTGFDLMNAAVDAGNLTMDEGDLKVALGDFSVTNPDGLVLKTFEDEMSLDMADLWVKTGNTFLGPKPGNPPGPTNFDNLYVSNGQVFIGDKQLPTSAPPGQGPVIPPTNETVFRIDGAGDFGFAGENHHVAFIKGYDLDPASAASTADGLAIQLDGLTVNAGVTSPANNYITFYDGTGLARGALQGSLAAGGNAPGVTLKTGSADFAEFLEKLDPDEIFSVGEIVGVFAGKVSKVVDKADHLLVITSSPAVLGNAPQPHMENLYAKVAFLGQVPVLVPGGANPGDYILPSGLNDGTGIAVSREGLQVEDLPSIVGTAWSNLEGSYVNVALGFKAINWGDIIDTEVNDLKKRVRQLEEMIGQLTGGNGRQPPSWGNQP